VRPQCGRIGLWQLRLTARLHRPPLDPLLAKNNFGPLEPQNRLAPLNISPDEENDDRRACLELSLK
jgi:hypothetical protein